MSSNVVTIVDSVRKKYGIDKLPVDLDKLATKAGIRIKYGAFKDQTSGFAYQKDGVKYIGVNATESDVRQRFTIAHEFGHIFLHQKDELQYDAALGSVFFRDEHSTTGESQKEIEANAFAAELLMPEQAVKSEIKKMGGIDLHDSFALAKLSNKFDVSTAAITVRLVKLYNVGLS